MQDFQGFDQIVLKPNDYDVTYTFNFPACSGIEENDGFLPFGTNLDSVAVSGYSESGVVDNTLLVAKATVSTNIVTVRLKYPTGGTGRYSIDFELRDGSQIFDADFESVFAH